MRLACCASVLLVSSVVGFSSAAVIPRLVTSFKADALEVVVVALELFGNMPGDRLALAIGVRSEIDGLDTGGSVLNVFDDLFSCR